MFDWPFPYTPQGPSDSDVLNALWGMPDWLAVSIVVFCTAACLTLYIFDDDA
jgi:hypothetical protein